MKILKKISLKLKLSLLFSIIFLTLLTFFSAFLYYKFYNLQVKEFDSTLFNFAVDIAESLDVDSYGEVDFDSDILKVNEKILPFSLKKSFISVLDINDNVISYWPKKRGYHLFKLPRDVLNEVLKNGVSFSSIEIYNQPHRLIRYLVPILKKDEPVILQVFVPETDFLLINNSIKKIFYFCFPVFLLVSLFVGYLFVKSSLQPMMEIINTTKNIQAHNLKDRVPIPDSNDEIWQLAMTINLLLERLESAFQVQEKFVQDASHQMKTPISILKGEIEIFKSKEHSKEETKNFTESLLQEISLLNFLTQNLITLARIESGHAHFQFENVRVDEVVISQVSRLLKYAQHKNQTLNINFDSLENSNEHSLCIWADKEMVGTLFYNLLENALKYSPDGSVILVKGSLENDFITIAINNPGEEFTPEELDLIFQRFYRAKKMSHQVQGSGLGLAICKAICDSIGANLSVHSSSRDGITFEFRQKYINV